MTSKPVPGTNPAVREYDRRRHDERRRARLESYHKRLNEAQVLIILVTSDLYGADASRDLAADELDADASRDLAADELESLRHRASSLDSTLRNLREAIDYDG